MPASDVDMDDDSEEEVPDWCRKMEYADRKAFHIDPTGEKEKKRKIFYNMVKVKDPLNEDPKVPKEPRRVRYRKYDTVLVAGENEPRPFLGVILEIFAALQDHEDEDVGKQLERGKVYITVYWFYRRHEIPEDLQNRLRTNSDPVSSMIINNKREVEATSTRHVCFSNHLDKVPAHSLLGHSQVMLLLEDDEMVPTYKLTRPDAKKVEARVPGFVCRQFYDINRKKIRSLGRACEDEDAGKVVKSLIMRSRRYIDKMNEKHKDQQE